MRSNIERWFPLITSLFMCAFFYSTGKNNLISDSLKDVLSASITFNSITIGFLATSMSILVTVENTRIIKQLKEAKVYSKLINYFTAAIEASFVSVVLSLTGLFIDLKHIEKIYTLAFLIWIFFLIYSGLTCYRVIILFAKILKTTNKNN